MPSNLHVPAGPLAELAPWTADHLDAHIVSGGLPVVPSSSLTLGALATTGYVRNPGQGLVYVTQAAAPIGPFTAGNGLYWLALHRNSVTAVGGWTRQRGTHYLWVQSPTQPTLPSESAFLASITVAGGVITAVNDIRIPRSFVTRGVYDVTDPLYGAVSSPTHAVSSLAAFRGAVNAGKRLHIPAGVYWLGDVATDATRLIDLSPQGDGITITTEGVVQLVCRTTGNVPCIPFFFYTYFNSFLTCGPIQFLDLGFDATVSWKGACGWYLFNDGAASGWGNCHFDSIRAQNCVAAMIIARNPVNQNANRIKGIHIGFMAAIEGYYGLNCQNDGDDIKIDSLYSEHNYRPYLCYGISGHTIDLLYNRRNRPTSGMMDISRAVAGVFRTSGIRINYVSRDNEAEASNSPHLLVQHTDLAGGEITDIHINFDIKNNAAGTAYRVARFVNYDGAGNETSAPSNNVVRDIRLSGSCTADAEPIQCEAAYTNPKGALTFLPGFHFTAHQSLWDAFQVATVLAGTAADMLWIGGTLGNGTLTYTLDLFQGMAYFTMHLLFGSTTVATPASGWTFTSFTAYNGVNLTVKARSVGTILVNRPFGNTFVGAVVAEPGALTLTCYGNNLGTGFSDTAPHTWTTGDSLDMSLLFPLSG